MLVLNVCPTKKCAPPCQNYPFNVPHQKYVSHHMLHMPHQKYVPHRHILHPKCAPPAISHDPTNGYPFTSAWFLVDVYQNDVCYAHFPSSQLKKL